ncbi:hypothetical protein CCS79_12465 [Clostridium diolis]|uniref:alpha-1,2-fucosyltransferase n=1 Tax=Clostridium diolis TaxID=223919 RepID=UPI000B3FF29A|nr:alpha-1,2-fucosyltransferase [Clostridium diolis]OVE67763.1 hypothetical protein CCS79_12465 [Clostridium diolis]
MLYVLSDGMGQRCNKMIFVANVLASAKEHNFIVKYNNFPIEECFLCNDPTLNKNLVKIEGFEKYLAKVKIVSIKLMRKIFKKVPQNVFYNFGDKGGEIVKNYLLNKKFNDFEIYWIGWPYYDLESFRKNKDIIREYFKESSELKSKVDKYVELLGKYDILVGVHIRRGDYKEWRDGKFYFDNATYKKNMDAFYQVNSSSNITFILFSNEKLNIDDFADPRYIVTCSNKTDVEDLMIMSRCDYIIGPPSTYSGWASFYGNKPKFMIEDTTNTFDCRKSKIYLLETDDWGDPI